MLYTIMGNKSKLLGQRWFFPEMYKSHVYTISSAITNQNAKLIHPLKIETKIRHACLEFHLQLNITYSYFADESFKPSHVIKYKIQKSDELHRELYLFARCINISRLVGNGPAKNTSISLPVHFISPSVSAHTQHRIYKDGPSNERKAYKFSNNYKLYPGKSQRFLLIFLILQLGNGISIWFCELWEISFV